LSKCLIRNTFFLRSVSFLLSFILNKNFGATAFHQLVIMPSNKYFFMRAGQGEGKYVNAFSVEFPLVCYQQAGRVWYISGALWRTYTLFYPAPCTHFPSYGPNKKVVVMVRQSVRCRYVISTQVLSFMSRSLF